MLAVTDMDRSVAFYKKVFGLRVIQDFGANKTLTGGLALQTVQTYKELEQTIFRLAEIIAKFTLKKMISINCSLN